MSPTEIAARLTALDWSATSLQHQLAISCAVETLDPSRAKPALAPVDVYDNVVALFPPTRPLPPMRHVRLERLDGTLFATAGFYPGLASDPWNWIVETISEELGVAPEAIGCVEPDEDDSGGDFVTVDGLPCYRVAIPASR